MAGYAWEVPLQQAKDKDSIKQKIRGMTTFLEDAMEWYEQMRQVPHTTLKKLIKLGSRVVRFLGTSEK